MGLINFILNLAGLLLWLSWRGSRPDPLLKPSAASLAGTLRRTSPTAMTRWKYFGGLVALLLGRSVIYWEIGPAVDWTPRLQLVAIAPPFRSEVPARMVLFSLFSFAATLVVFYLSLLLLSAINRRVSDAEPLQKLVRRQLGRVERLPLSGKLLLPAIAVTALWALLSPLLTRWSITPPVASFDMVLWQGLLIGVGVCLVWKYVIAGLLLLHFLNNYIYFGNHPLWNYVSLTSRHLLAPLRGLPLQFGRMDLAPVVGIVAVFLAAEFIQHWLPKIYPS
jgi:uncharacterized protein YggT (Ycf19 family)